jgi:class 3 adenylate cyclase/alpha-beta hydrolase superfamily lysophospholipase
VKVPEIQYARSGDVSLAYVVSGAGSLDLVFVHGFVGNLETSWEQPLRQAFFERLGAFARVIEFDRRGTGLSDRVRDVPTLETRMDDLRAVMDAAGSQRAAVFATFEAGAMAALYAATYPERVAGLALYNPIAKGEWSPDYPFALTEAEWSSELAEIRERWGQPEFFAEFTRAIAPSRADDPAYAAWTAKLLRTGASPGAALAIQRMVRDVDIRDVLPSIRVPTLVLHLAEHADESRYVAERIPGALRVEISGSDTVFFLAPGIAEELERFVKNAGGAAEPETILSTLLFTDIVGSTERAAELGDRRWAELVGSHNALVRQQLDRFRGRELDTAGDGFFASFDGPARGIRCASAIVEAVRALGLEVRAGLHTGECEVIGEKLGGIAVNIGARVASRAGPGEVLVSSTVKDLVAGSGIRFADRTAVELKGVPGTWQLFAVDTAERT